MVTQERESPSPSYPVTGGLRELVKTSSPFGKKSFPFVLSGLTAFTYLPRLDWLMVLYSFSFFD
jgi:hypothetical protein